MAFAWQCDPREQLEHGGSLKDGEEGDPATWLEGQRVPAGLHTVCLSPTLDNKHETGPLIYSTHTHIYREKKERLQGFNQDENKILRAQRKQYPEVTFSCLGLVPVPGFKSLFKVIKLPMCEFLYPSESERCACRGSEVKRIKVRATVCPINSSKS